MKNYFRKKKINYCYGFMPGDFQVICGSVVGENLRSPVSTETPDLQQDFKSESIELFGALQKHRKKCKNRHK